MNLYNKDQQAQDIAKYGFIVHPYDDGYVKEAPGWTLEVCIEQSKAHRAYLWDTAGTAGKIPLDWFEQRDKEIADMELELRHRNAFEALKASSDEELLHKTRAFLIALTANNNEFAHKLGMTDEKINNLHEHLAKFENAVKHEKQSARINLARRTCLARQTKY